MMVIGSSQAEPDGIQVISGVDIMNGHEMSKPSLNPRWLWGSTSFHKELLYVIKCRPTFLDT